MKQINLTQMLKDNDWDNVEERRILGMEFIKRPDGNYIVKDSGFVVSEKEMLKMQNEELVIKDISATCAKNITKEISKNKKRIKEIETIEETEPTKE